MKPIITLALFALFLLGCTRTLYIPNAVNTPLFERKDDYSGALNMRVIAPLNMEFQGAYAPINHFAVMANGSYIGYNNSNNQSELHHYLMEAGAGLFTAFWENNCKSKIMRVECFGGIGTGGADITDDSGELFFNDPTIYSYDGQYQRKFLQLGYGLRTRVVDLSLATRFATINFSNYHDFEDGKLTDRGTYNFSTIEPTFKLAFGYKQLKFGAQIGFAESLGKSTADFNAATGSAWGNLHFNGSIIVRSFHEDCPPMPTISLGVAEANDSIAYSGKYPPPPAILQLYSANATICLQDGGSPDGDIISASFNGAFVLPETELGRKPVCFEVTLLPDAENTLQIHSISNGRRNPNTVKITIKEGKLERTYYLLTDAGRTEEIRLKF